LAALLLAACSTLESGKNAAMPPPDPKAQMGALESRIAILVEEQRQKLDPRPARWRSIRSFPKLPAPGPATWRPRAISPMPPQWRHLRLAVDAAG